jgi:hypothetical protein
MPYHHQNQRWWLPRSKRRAKFMRPIIKLIILAALISSTTCAAKDITYMGLGGDRDAYHTELLTEIFNHSAALGYEVKRYSETLPHHRAFGFLTAQKGIDIVIAYATEERDQAYLAVPYPILRGLNGWRLCAVHKDNSAIFNKVTRLDELKVFKAGQLYAWTDNKILTFNGITPVNGSDFIGLYQMLQKKRFDYLPRSILEAEHEVNSIAQQEKINIVIEPNILLYYPTAFYFYVNKNNKALAKELTLGFEAIIKNGKVDAIFYRHYGKIIADIRKEQRKIIVLENPLLPRSTPLARKELWVGLFDTHNDLQQKKLQKPTASSPPQQ